MSSHSQILESLREHGVRLTPQRVMILEIICDSRGHLSADEVFRRAQLVHPYLDRSTVYRTLEFFKEQGIVTETDLGGGRAEYELAGGQPHHHLVCRRCGQIIQADHVLFQPLQDALLEHCGFAADLQHFAVWGTCRTCREADAAQPPAMS